MREDVEAAVETPRRDRAAGPSLDDRAPTVPFEVMIVSDREPDASGRGRAG